MPIQLLIIILIVFLALANLAHYVWFKPAQYIEKYLTPYKHLPEWFPFRNLFISSVKSRSSMTIWLVRIFTIIVFLGMMTLIVFLTFHL